VTVESREKARLEIKVASTPAEVQACEEIIRTGFGRVMRLGVDSEADEQRSLTTLYCADSENGRILATSRLVWLDYLARSPELVREYRIENLPAELRKRSMLSFQSAALPDQRGTELMSLLFRGCFQYLVEHDALLTLSACKPYLFPYFMSMGFRPFERAYVSSEGGYRVPIVLVNHDLEYLRACRSPFAAVLGSAREVAGASEAKRWYEQNRPPDEKLNVRVISRPEHVDFELGFLKGLNDTTIHSIFRYGVVITCQRGDQLVKEMAAEQVIGFILDGSLDVVKGGRAITTLKAGEIFGELSFLLKVPRTASLLASADNTRIAFISMHSIDAIKDPAETSLFWRNLSTRLADRLRNSTELL
jgi:hypothetical protein